MVMKVQVMTTDEVQRHEKFRKEQDEFCDKIKICICCSLVIFIFVYCIVLIISSYIMFNDIE